MKGRGGGEKHSVLLPPLLLTSLCSFESLSFFLVSLRLMKSMMVTLSCEEDWACGTNTLKFVIRGQC